MDSSSIWKTIIIHHLPLLKLSAQPLQQPPPSLLSVFSTSYCFIFKPLSPHRHHITCIITHAMGTPVTMHFITVSERLSTSQHLGTSAALKHIALQITLTSSTRESLTARGGNVQVTPMTSKDNLHTIKCPV